GRGRGRRDHRSRARPGLPARHARPRRVPVLRLPAGLRAARRDANRPQAEGPVRRSGAPAEASVTRLADQEARDRIRDDLGTTLAVEAGVDPLFAVAPRDVAEGLLDRAFDRWFEETLAKPAEAMRRILRRRTRDEGPRRLLRTTARDLVERRDFPATWRHEEGFER